MSKIGYGYGSEWHLLRYLGYHRNQLVDYIKSAFPYFTDTKISFLDFNFSLSNIKLAQDQEYKGIDVINDPALSRAWKAFWPQSGNSQNWDAVAIMDNSDSQTEWIFVEAKAHTEEIKSSCGAQNESRKIIENALQSTIDYFGFQPNSTRDWLEPYYQFCNRLALLKFLLTNNIKAHLLFIYFYGDSNANGICPKNQTEWDKPLGEMYAHIGINPSVSNTLYTHGVHKIFLSTNPNVI